MANTDYLSRNKRTTALGKLGEELAAEALQRNGFENVVNLNPPGGRYQPYADLLAERDEKRYFISVKARNERQVGGKGRADLAKLS